MTTTADVVVAGAGHNGLVTAAYLARAGREVIVLDARPIPGGGVGTEELIPGYRIDIAATGHGKIQSNPVIANDELGLLADCGLEYVHPDPVNRLAFPDGETLTSWLDVDRTVAGIERFSRADARTYRRMLEEWNRVKRIFGRCDSNPAGWVPSVDEALPSSSEGNIWRRRKMLSAWDVVRHEYEDRHVRAFVLWAVSQSMTPVDLPGSGLLAVSAVAGRQAKSWPIAIGGSGALSDALVRVIEAHGGTVLCGRWVVRLVLDRGRCVGVESEDGERFDGRDAVVSSIHVKHLIDMAPRDVWDDDFVYGVETLDPGIPLFAVHLATMEAPLFAGCEDQPVAVASGLAAWPEDLVDVMRRLRDGVPSSDFASVLIATPTVVDASRAPAGRHTIKLVSGASPVPPAGSTTWDDAKEEHADRLVAAVERAAPNLTNDVVLERRVASPSDLERSNPHMVRGTAHGGDRGLPFSGVLRPAPGWAQHRLPLRGLYQTGATTHPGGSVSGFPGRNAAMVVLQDLGIDFGGVVRP